MEVIRSEGLTDEVTIILIQDATDISLTVGNVCVLADDAPAATPYRKIGYSEMLDAIFHADTVVTW